MAEGTEQEDKTEELIFQRLEQAIERGDIADSVEINSFLIHWAFTPALLLAASLVAQWLSSDM